jgi:hypothetical protein
VGARGLLAALEPQGRLTPRHRRRASAEMAQRS